MNNDPMTAIVEFQVNSETTTTDEWLNEWAVRAEDARDGEPDTPAYASALNAESEGSVLVFERYAHGDDSLSKHSARDAHERLHSRMGENNMTKRRVMSARFSDVSGYGWWSRKDHRDLMNEPNVIVTILGMRFETAEQRDRFIDLSQVHAQYCWNEEPDTLVYSGGIATSDADREIDLRTGDLVFVMACTDLAAVEKHRDDPNHLALGEKFAQAGINIESPFMRTYRTTGHGYLWK